MYLLRRPMKKTLYPLFFILLAAFRAGSEPGPAAKDPDPSPYDLIVDHSEWTSPSGKLIDFCLLGKAGEERARTAAVYQFEQGEWNRAFLDRDRNFSPWKIEAVELDGDPMPEVAVGVYKTTVRDPVARNRLFIFDWNEDHTLAAKWLGSSLGLPLLDFGFQAGADGKDRLVTIEQNGDERLVLRAYRWKGFGFAHEREIIRVVNPKDKNDAISRLEKKLIELTEKGERP